MCNYVCTILSCSISDHIMYLRGHIFSLPFKWADLYRCLAKNQRVREPCYIHNYKKLPFCHNPHSMSYSTHQHMPHTLHCNHLMVEEVEACRVQLLSLGLLSHEDGVRLCTHNHEAMKKTNYKLFVASMTIGQHPYLSY